MILSCFMVLNENKHCIFMIHIVMDINERQDLAYICYNNGHNLYLLGVNTLVTISKTLLFEYHITIHNATFRYDYTTFNINLMSRCWLILLKRVISCTCPIAKLVGQPHCIKYLATEMTGIGAIPTRAYISSKYYCDLDYLLCLQ